MQGGNAVAMNPLAFNPFDREVVTLGTGVEELLTQCIASSLGQRGAGSSHRIRRACG